MGAVSFLLLAGCFTPETYMELPDGIKVFGDFHKVEIIDHQIVTEGYTSEGYQTIGDGFIKSENASRYRINITAKNSGAIQYIGIEAWFYDTNDTVVSKKIESVEQTDTTPLIQGQILYFELVYAQDEDHFNDVDHVSFRIYTDIVV